MKKIKNNPNKIESVKGYYLRKVTDISPDNDILKLDISFGETAIVNYKVSYEVVLNNSEWNNLINYTLKDMEWIEDGVGGVYKEGLKTIVNVIKVYNSSKDKYILVNPEGYKYPRYVIIPEDYKF